MRVLLIVVSVNDEIHFLPLSLLRSRSLKCQSPMASLTRVKEVFAISLALHSEQSKPLAKHRTIYSHDGLASHIRAVAHLSRSKRHFDVTVGCYGFICYVKMEFTMAVCSFFFALSKYIRLKSVLI